MHLRAYDEQFHGHWCMNLGFHPRVDNLLRDDEDDDDDNCHDDRRPVDLRDLLKQRYVFLKQSHVSLIHRCVLTSVT